MFYISPLQKASQWVSSAFGDFDDEFQSKVRGVPKASTSLFGSKNSGKTIKRSFQEMSNGASNSGSNSRKLAERRVNKVPENSLWSEKYTPATQV